MDGTIATVMIFAGSFPPRYTTYCGGQIIAISQNQALFSLIGDSYGGDARTTMGVPDMRARAPVGSYDMGTPPGLAPIIRGQRTGNQISILSLAELPTHNHNAIFTPTGGSAGDPIALNALNVIGTETDPTGNMIADASGSSKSFAPKGTNTPVEMDPASITGGGGGITGGVVTVEDAGLGKEFSILNPIQGINYVIFIDGTYPQRN